MAVVQEYLFAGEDTNQVMDADAEQYGQSFTIGSVSSPNISFNCYQIVLRLSRVGTPGDIIWQIREANPAFYPIGSAIVSGTITSTDVFVGSGEKWTISLATVQGNLIRDKSYVLTFSSSSLDASNYYIIKSDASTPTYGGGFAISSTDSGSTWGAVSGTDLMFGIYSEGFTGTLCTLSEAVEKAGANANSAAVNEQLVSNFVLQAEGLINATTRYDWVAAYSGLTDQVKYILNRVTSSLAAISIITYDMSGYTAATAEAETMINVYREDALMGLSLLRDQEVKKFITGDT